MNITEFVASNANVKPKADIVERWESRIVAQGLHIAGRRGAEGYLGQYGKGIAAPKLIGFARCADIKGFPLMAARFWEEAFFMTTGTRGSLDAGSAPAVSAVAVVLPTVALKAAFGRTPQLPAITDMEVIESLLLDDNYGIQEKADGKNSMIDVRDGTVSGGNKKGLAAAVPLAVADAAGKLGNIKLDAENVNGTYYAFDIVELAGKDLRELGYGKRHAALVKAAANLDPKGALRVIPLVRGRAAKLAFREELRARKAEGFILKRLDAAYESGDSHEVQFKSQFRALGTFIVGERNGLKNSVQISVRRTDGTLRDMGNLTVRDIPTEGSVVEVEYLYCHTGAKGKLHQPVFKGIRDDAAPEDCLESKLKVKADDE